MYSGKFFTHKLIVPRPAGQRVVAAPAEEAIVSLAAIQLVAARSVGGREHLDPKKVRTVQVITRQQIIAGIARQHIIAAAALYEIITSAALHADIARKSRRVANHYVQHVATLDYDD